jgi:hypothetical protein
VITLLGGPGALYALVTRQDWFFAVWVGGLAFIWYQVLRTAYAVTLDGDVCRFRGLVRRTNVPVQQIESLRASRMGGNVVTLRHRDGKILILQPIAEFHDFVSRLKKLNPAVELRGV